MNSPSQCPTVLAYVCLALCVACTCRSHVVDEDGGEDAAAQRCVDEVPEGRACIEGGWFELPLWSPTVLPPLPPADVVPTYLDAFMLDVHEVTNEAYAEFVRTGATPPIPDDCGRMNEIFMDIREIYEVEQTSAWRDGAPRAELRDHPVVCVTRAEAMAYCTFRDGRLPNVFEMMRAARGPSPARPRTPWGDEPPPVARSPWNELDPDWFASYAVLGAPFEETEIRTGPAGAESLGVSPEGVRGLVGNASEFVVDCYEGVTAARPFPLPEMLVRPALPPQDHCPSHEVIVGSNWRSWVHEDSFGVSPLSWTRSGFGSLGGSNTRALMGDGHTGRDADSERGRSWRVGFRCAYDVD